MVSEKKLLILGAGPAGLTAAYRAVQRGLKPLVLEQRGQVGGIAATEDHKGFLFDMGGHRFFSAHAGINRVWDDLLGQDFIIRSRLSRIYYKGKFFDYPLRPRNALRNIDPWTAFRFLQSYLWWHLFPHREEETFEHWVTNRFGKRLFEAFFKSYTEKVWGISCAELRAEWAAQRIRNLTLTRTLAKMFLDSKKKVRSLIEEFHYPTRGPGMMWSAASDYIEAHGGSVLLNHEVVGLVREGSRVTGVTVSNGEGEKFMAADQVISSMPLTALATKLTPPPSEEVREAADRLCYRAFLTVCLIVDRDQVFPDQWIYIHDPEVKMGRIQNYKNWSPAMVPDPGRTGLGLEYFCNAGDELWNRPDEELLELGKTELDRMGLVNRDEVMDGVVYRIPKAYPVYDEGYKENLEKIRAFAEGLENIQTIGRNGLFRYNNMDHSMLTALYAVDNLFDGEKRDVWQVNMEQTYHEEEVDEEKVARDSLHGTALDSVFVKLDKTALGVALGAVAGVGLFLMTLVLIIKGGDTVGSNLALLGQYFPGYTVTLPGCGLGLLYGFLAGFLVGWIVAALRNLAMAALWIILRYKARKVLLKRFMDYI